MTFSLTNNSSVKPQGEGAMNLGGGREGSGNSLHLGNYGYLQ